jgi:hypothetical protein
MSTYTKTLKFTLTTNVGDEIPVDVEADFIYQPPEPETSTYPGCEEKVTLEYLSFAGSEADLNRLVNSNYIRNIEEDELARIKYERGTVCHD